MLCDVRDPCVLSRSLCLILSVVVVASCSVGTGKHEGHKAADDGSAIAGPSPTPNPTPAAPCGSEPGGEVGLPTGIYKVDGCYLAGLQARAAGELAASCVHFAESCRLGSGPGCQQDGMCRDLAGQISAAMASYRRACALGYGSGCFSIGDGGRRCRFPRRLVLPPLQQACDLGHAEACVMPLRLGEDPEQVDGPDETEWTPSSSWCQAFRQALEQP